MSVGSVGGGGAVVEALTQALVNRLQPGDEELGGLPLAALPPQMAGLGTRTDRYA